MAGSALRMTGFSVDAVAMVGEGRGDPVCGVASLGSKLPEALGAGDMSTTLGAIAPDLAASAGLGSPGLDGDVLSGTCGTCATSAAGLVRPGIMTLTVCTALRMGSRKSQPAATRKPPRKSSARPIMNTFEARLGLLSGRERDTPAAGDAGRERPGLSSGWAAACGAEGMLRDSKVLPLWEELPTLPIMGRVGAPGIKELCPAPPERDGRGCCSGDMGCAGPDPQAGCMGAPGGPPGLPPIKPPANGTCPS